MEVWILLIGLFIGAILGSVIGFFFAKSKGTQVTNFSQQLTTIANLGTQVTEMKVKFEEIEKSRNALEKERERLNEEKEKRLKEWMDSTTRIFEEISDKSEKTAEEKEKRIQEWMDSTKRFFEEQRLRTEEFLKAQDKMREDIERQRDAQIRDMRNIMDSFMHTISGTKSRGMVGEEILQEVLQNSIQVGLVEKNLQTSAGVVEFAWKLDANKYIPIDAKLPDIFELVDKYNIIENAEERKVLRKNISEKIKGQIKKVQVYQNLSNTIDNCILVVPPAALEIAPEIVSLGKESNVFVCTYKDVFPLAYILQEQYIRMKEEGDIGVYKQLVKSLLQILENISEKTDTIRRAIVQVNNATDSIRDEIIKGKDAGKRSSGV